MRIVFAGEKAVKTINFLSQAGCRHKLVSYGYPSQFSNWCKILEEQGRTNKETTLILDSGAFSAWRTKMVIDIDKYIEYIKKTLEFEHYFEEYTVINLDVIPGDFGRIPSGEEVEDSAKRGWDNLMYMKDKLGGRIIMHTFHQGENFKWLKKMMDHDLNYIGISPANDRTLDQKKEWLNQVFQFICDEDGMPKIRTHGLAVTAFDLIDQYPFFSLDSTTWALVGSYGNIMMPQPKVDGTWNYAKRSMIVTLSKENPAQMVKGRHYLNMNREEQAVIERYLGEKGYDVMKCVEDYNLRDQLNVLYFIELQKFYEGTKPFKRQLNATLL